MHYKFIIEEYHKYISIIKYKYNDPHRLINNYIFMYVIIGFMIVTSCSSERKLSNVSNDETKNSIPSFVINENIYKQSEVQPIYTEGFKDVILYKDKCLYGKNYSFALTSDSSAMIPNATQWDTKITIKQDEVYWTRYADKTLYRYLWIRIANTKNNKVVIEYVISNHTDIIPNINANKDKNASGLEIPFLNDKYTYAAHSVKINGKKVMNLAIEWVKEKKHSNWVAFSFDSITSQDLIKRTNRWDNDPILQPKTETTYWNNLHLYDGFDKGHLCASEDRVYCMDANLQTFYYSNISPQFKSFNSGFWQKLEYKIQHWGRLTIDEIYDKVYVVKGGTINKLIKNYYAKHKNADGQFPNTDTKGFTKGGIACPKYYFIAILTVKDNDYKSIGFWVEHREDLPTNPKVKDLKACTITIDELEKLTNIDFFCNLPDELENEVEANIDINSWIW